MSLLSRRSFLRVVAAITTATTFLRKQEEDTTPYLKRDKVDFMLEAWEVTITNELVPHGEKYYFTDITSLRVQ